MTDGVGEKVHVRTGRPGWRQAADGRRQTADGRRQTTVFVMANPVLVEALRGPAVESLHRGSIAVLDADAGVLLALGETQRPVYPRSAVKALQALPLVESGAANRLGLDDAELALACASHRGEPRHTKAVAGVLAKAGLDADALECGIHWPYDEAAARALAAQGRRPSA